MHFVVYDKYGRQKSHTTSSPAPIEYVGSGGLLIGGGAVVSFPTLHTPTGGVLLGGGADILFPTLHVPTGGVLLGGGATLRYPFTLVPTGGLLIGSSAVVDIPFRVIGNGGILIGGAAEREGPPYHLWRMENVGTDEGVGPAISLVLDGTNVGYDTSFHDEGTYSLSLSQAFGDIEPYCHLDGEVIPSLSGDFSVAFKCKLLETVDTDEVGIWGTNVALSNIRDEACFKVYLDSAANIVAGWNVSEVTAASGLTLANTGWFPVVITRKASTNLLTVYLNGVSIGSGTLTGNPATAAQYSITFNGSAPGSMESRIAWFDDMRVYDRCLTAGEAADYSAPSLTTLTDTFTDTDFTAITAHTPDSGGTWSSGDGSAAIYTNRYFQNFGSFSYVSWVIPTADYTVKGRIFRYNGSGSYADVTGRYDSGSDSAYVAEVNTSASPSEAILYYKAGGMFTQLGSTYTFPRPADGGSFDLELVMVGTSISVKVDGTTGISVTDGSLTLAGKAGVRVPSGSRINGPVIEEFSVTY